VSKRIFTYVDYAINTALWHWACRRHPRKRKDWIRRKYFQLADQYGFFGRTTGKKGQTIIVRLFVAHLVPIRRHVKIRGEANPYDPAQAAYFEQRLGEKWLQEQNRLKLRTLWWQQGGACLVCAQPITSTSGWNIHHLVPRVKGGEDKLSNLVLLHPNCHRQVHCRKWKVVKPGLARGH